MHMSQTYAYLFNVFHPYLSTISFSDTVPGAGYVG